MSYVRRPPIRDEFAGKHFLLDDEDREYELTVDFKYHEWSEPQPYGDTVAYERLSETEVTGYRLDGSAVDLSKLYAKFGVEQVDEAVDEATFKGVHT